MAAEGVALTAEVASRAAVTTGAPTETVASTAADLPTAPTMAALMAAEAEAAPSEDHLRHAKADRGLGPQKAKAFATPLPAGTGFNDQGTALMEREDPPARAWLEGPRAQDRRAEDPRAEDPKVRVLLDDPVPKPYMPQLPTDSGIPSEQLTGPRRRRLAPGPDRHWPQIPIPQAQPSTMEPCSLTGMGMVMAMAMATVGAGEDGVGAAAVGASASDGGVGASVGAPIGAGPTTTVIRRG